MIRYVLMCWCVAHSVSVGAGIVGRDDEVPAARNGGPQSTGYLSKGRPRPLFARRGQHEHHKLVLKDNIASVFPSDLSSPPKVVPKPSKLKCSQHTQSCFPKSGCCDPCTTCHCRFFKSICFCRRTEEMKDSEATGKSNNPHCRPVSSDVKSGVLHPHGKQTDPS